MSAPAIISSGTAAGGPPVGGSGTIDTIPRWSGVSTLGDSLLSQSGAIVTNSGTFRTADGSNSEPGYTFSGSSGSGMYRGTSGTVLRFASSGAFAFGVSSAQNVLIGGSATVAPTARLQVVGTATNNAAYLIGSTTVGQSFGAVIEAGTNASDRSFAVYNSGLTSPYLFVRGDGNVGIGTASPGAKLDVSDTANQLRATVSNSTPAVTTYALGLREGYISARQENSGSFNVFTDIVSSTSQFTPSGLRFFTHASGDASISERARIDSTGRLQVGASNAAGAAANTALLLRNPAATNNPAELLLQNGYTLPGINSGLGTLKFQDASGNTYAQISAQVDAADGANDLPGRIVFSTVPDGSNVVTERARIDSAGNFAVGRVPTVGTIFETQGDQVTFRDAAGNVRFRFEAANSLLNIGIGSGWGLKLPATPGNADTQTLDCYQENYASNSWTPVIYGSTSAGTATYTVQEGFYTRWGNLVFCTATVVFSGHTGTGNLSLSGLPFASKTAGSGTYRSTVIIEEGGGVKAILRIQGSATTASTNGVAIAASGNYVITFVYATN